MTGQRNSLVIACACSYCLLKPQNYPSEPRIIQEMLFDHLTDTQDALLVIMMELLKICHTNNVRTEHLHLYCFDSFHFCTDCIESLRCTTPVESRFHFFISFHLNLNIEICVEYFSQVFKIAEKQFTFSLYYQTVF